MQVYYFHKLNSNYFCLSVSADLAAFYNITKRLTLDILATKDGNTSILLNTDRQDLILGSCCQKMCFG